MMASAASTPAHPVGEPTLVNHQTNGNDNTFTPVQQPQAHPSVHKRTYQACTACRKRKVKCDLGDVDAPSDPPCLRCRREKKNCVFSDTRRKRKASDDSFLDEDGEDASSLRNKRASTGSEDANIGLPGTAAGQRSTSDAEARSVLTLAGTKKNAGNGRIKNDAAVAMFQQAINKPTDAMTMLSNAAANAASNLKQEQIDHPRADIGRSASQSVDPMVITLPYGGVPDPILSTAIEAWSGVRFVRAGWFTPLEGIAYVTYFYEYLSPLSPILPPNFSLPELQPRLLKEEPMLLVTILAIASRYMSLKGPGAKSRSFWIHDKLWGYLQGMLTRMFWGQEQFGGGFCGAGGLSVEDAEAKKRGLRSLGTIESLLLLSDWLPRSMHFPPGDDGDEVWTSPQELNNRQGGLRTVQSHLAWTEPAIRSDRMCWSLVGMAYSLAFELGVFDSLIEKGKWTVGPVPKTSYDSERADRIGRMLFVYVTQACGRLGFPNMMPHQGTETNLDFLKMDVPPGSYTGPYNTVTVTDNIQRAWAELTTLIRSSNTEMFDSNEKTRRSVLNGQYDVYIQTYNPQLTIWRERFDQTDIPDTAKWMLLIEWNYARTFVNSLALQAILERVGVGSVDVDHEPVGMGHALPGLVSSEIVDFKKQNEPYIKELVQATRDILDIAVHKLYSEKDVENKLRKVPVRTHFRILSGAMFLLKSFALGGKESEINISMKLLMETCKALRESVPDDTHLSLRIAELLSSLIASMRTKFERLPPPPNKRANQGRPSSLQLNAVSTNGASGSTTGTQAVNSKGNRRRQSSLATTMMHSPTQREFSGALAEIPLANLNDPNAMFMPPYDTFYHFQSPTSPHSITGGMYSPSAHNGNLTINSPKDRGSPVITSATAAHRKQNVPFSPTQATSRPLPFSPGSVSSDPNYNWVALNFANMNGAPQHGQVARGFSENPTDFAATSIHGGPNGPQGSVTGQDAATVLDGRLANDAIEGALGWEISENWRWLDRNFRVEGAQLDWDQLNGSPRGGRIVNRRLQNVRANFPQVCREPLPTSERDVGRWKPSSPSAQSVGYITNG